MGEIHLEEIPETGCSGEHLRLVRPEGTSNTIVIAVISRDW